MKVIIVCTSASDLGGHKTGLWLEEAAEPYYLFNKKGYQTVIASPAGGEIPLDDASLKGDFYTEVSQKFMEDKEALGKLQKSQPLSAIDFKTVDAIYLAGGHGACIDFVDNKELKAAIETVAKSGKVVSAVCHGLIALPQCVTPDGKPLVQGKSVTGFSDTEEEAVKLTEKVPFQVESKIKEQGGNYSKADADWNVHVCVDGKLVTGQNPASSSAVAQKVVELLLL